MGEIGSWRDSDPSTSEEAARSIDATSIKYLILKELHETGSPLNGWELSVLLEMPTITVVPRLCPMRQGGWIMQQGERPGPTNRAQIAYVITEVGRKILGSPPLAPINYARGIWPQGFTKPELEEALHKPTSIEELKKQKAIEDTGIRRHTGKKKHVVWRFKPYQLKLPLADR
jgi:hypothetical protein